MVRIENNDPLQKPYSNTVNQSKRKDAVANRSDSTGSASAAEVSGISRDARIQKLKADFVAGKPIDVKQLADTLVKSGIFFDAQG